MPFRKAGSGQEGSGGPPGWRWGWEAYSEGREGMGGFKMLCRMADEDRETRPEDL